LTSPFQIQILSSSGDWGHSWVTTDKYRNYFFDVQGSNQQYWLFLPNGAEFNGAQIRLFFHKTAASANGNIYQVFVAKDENNPSRIIGLINRSGSKPSTSIVSGTSVYTAGDDAYFVLNAIPCLTDNTKVSWILENYNEDMFTIA
jgi:hypothetical protein